MHVAYLTAEIGLRSDLPTYSGGLGVLAGDHVKAAADLGMPLTAVTLLYRHGYARQHLDGGTQTETFPSFDPSSLLEETGHILEDELEGRTVRLRMFGDIVAWESEGIRWMCCSWTRMLKGTIPWMSHSVIGSMGDHPALESDRSTSSVCVAFEHWSWWVSPSQRST